MAPRLSAPGTGRVVRAAAVLAATLAVIGCRPESRPRGAPALVAGRTLAPGSSVAILTDAAVVAFWLPSADTIPPDVRRRVREEFRRSNQAIAGYLADTDVGIVATVNDTLIVELQNGAQRLVMLSGLDFPYGYVFVEPGYAEEFHTGLDGDEALESAIDDYFGLEDDSQEPRHHIAAADGASGLEALRARRARAPFTQRLGLHPGPRTIRPGLAPVCWPSRTTRVPFTKTYLMPTETWWGCS